MKAGLKKLVGKKWYPIEIEKLKDKSIAQYVKESEDILIAALLDEGKPVLFITNSADQVQIYKEKAPTLLIDDFLLLLGTCGVPDQAIKVFPDATFEFIDTESKEEKIPWWKMKRS